VRSLGATLDAGGAGFVLYSERASRVELCLFDPAGRQIRCADLERGPGNVWHTYIAGAAAGQLYAYRVHGNSPRFDPSKTLLDPYARLMVGDLSAGEGRCCLVDPSFDWGEDRPPRTPWRDSVIYEAHVKGLTRLHPEIDPSIRGTYAGLATEPVIDHLKKLGVTAIELLPVHAFVDEPRLRSRGLRNYWGYNTIGFFAPELRYSATNSLDEFKAMVKALHAAGIEVILDVVYNHTGEGDAEGPMLSFRGIDDATYYRLKDGSYENFTGTGNTFNVAHPVVRQLVLDSLRYWVEEMHIDGFRFDLAPVLARDENAFQEDSPFFATLGSDPVLSKVKLIAEPWDVGPGGYRLGGFPAGWHEWNDRARNALRKFWRGDPGMLGELAARLEGSPDLFGTRAPEATVNFVTAHDGFTLEDLVSYERKHNEANGEDNRDGAEENFSRDWKEHKSSMKKNLLATLLLSRGVPMILAGDELGHTQHGNNNAYCQDNEISWLKWDSTELVDFVHQLTSLRKLVLQDEKVVWLAPSGQEMSEEDWKLPYARSVGMLSGELLLLLNAHDGEVVFSLPAGEWREKICKLQPRSIAILTPTSPGRARKDG
jgi:glycogen operon protein